MRKKKPSNHSVCITIPPEVFHAVEEYCAINYIPRTSFFVKATKELFDKLNLDSNAINKMIKK